MSQENAEQVQRGGGEGGKEEGGLTLQRGHCSKYRDTCDRAGEV